MPQQVLEFQQRDTLFQEMACCGMAKHRGRKWRFQPHSNGCRVQNPVNLRLRERSTLLREEDRR